MLLLISKQSGMLASRLGKCSRPSCRVCSYAMAVSDPPEDKKKDEFASWTDPSNATDWHRYRDPRTVVPVVILTGGILLVARFYKSYLKRIPQAIDISPNFWRKRSLFGKVTSVGDADNFRVFHTPGGRLAGWGWLPWRRVPDNVKELKDKTVR